ncbi:MAG: hypothetical protein ACE5J3_05855 [Methanosarcinales archaeon]
MEYIKLDLDRIGHVIDLDPNIIEEIANKNNSAFVSPKLYNKGIYRVRNKYNGLLEDFAVYLYKIEAATYEGLVKKLGYEKVDKELWKDVPEGSVLFFYGIKLENELIKYNHINNNLYISTNDAL